ncbi:hypothetical protein [Panacibacter ginsenosidivorans]|uniref:hypothetical protein n=1 Tax=Panacibacter ginsenosidivorans TaxID=1813871 RepID=UPI001315465E|nr:hypothetical protein [Panacibacter ginsenosidivorans]
MNKNMLRATRKLPIFFILTRFVFVLSILLLIAGTVNGQNCANTWLNVLAAKSGITIGDLDITGNKVTVEARISQTQAYNNSFYGGISFLNIVIPPT